MSLQEKPDICVIGLGYIGLPTAAIIARSGSKVLGVDVNPAVVETIAAGKIHIEEVDLDGLVKGVVSRGNLRTSLQLEPSDVFVIAVPTPFTEGHVPDISYVLEATPNVAACLKPGDIIVLESTSPVGTTEKMRDLISKLRPDLKVPGLTSEIPDIAIAYCPERVLPGKILEELINNDRSIGGITPRCARKALTFYKGFVRGECVTTDARSAEMTKLVENAYRDLNIAFANELSVIADKMELDVWEVIKLANRHPRVNILQPGPGVGGHCIAVDPWFIIHSAKDEAKLIKTARDVNDGKVDYVSKKSAELIAKHPTKRVACMGLAFKANIDDFRESPAKKVALDLAQEFGAQIDIVEPFAAELPEEFSSTGAKLIDLDDAIENCEIFINLVDHDVFKSIPLAERAQKMVYDTRGIWPDQPRYEDQALDLKLAS